jgi:hypothetical protein
MTIIIKYDKYYRSTFQQMKFKKSPRLVAHLHFYQHTSPNKKCKRATKPTHQDGHEMTTNKHDRERRAAHNKVLPKAGVMCFYDTFVLNRTLVFQINSSAEMPRLRQYPTRYPNLRFPNLNLFLK